MQGFKRAVFGALLAVAVAACGRPDFNTDLTPEGDPEVRAVGVAAESTRFLITGVETNEFPVYCATGVPEEKSLVHYCPEDGDDPGPGDIGPISDTAPIFFYVRVVFDELLDPSIETIDEENGVGILADGAITIECGGAAVAGSGFYQPSGSHLTFPAGPSLVFTVSDTVATGADCEVSVGGNVTDKDGNAVPSGQRGPYPFTIAPLHAVATEPADMAEMVEPTTIIAVQFNNFIDEGTLAGEITLNDDTAGADEPIDIVVNPDDPTLVEVTPQAGILSDSTTYTLTVASGTVADVNGGTLDQPITFSFTTGVAVLPDAGAPDA